MLDRSKNMQTTVITTMYLNTKMCKLEKTSKYFNMIT